MTNNRVTFHFSDTQTTFISATTCRLVGSLFSATLTSGIPLIFRHVLETHRVALANKNRTWNLNPSGSIIQEFISKLFHSKVFLQDFSDGLRRVTIVHKGCSIRNGSIMRGCLSKESLNQLRNGHTRRDRMGVHNHIRNKSLNCSRHIMSAHKHTNGSLLSVTIGKLVSQFRNSVLNDADFYKTPSIIIDCDSHFFYTTSGPHLRRYTGITINTPSCSDVATNDDSVLIYIGSLFHNASFIELCVIQTSTYIRPCWNTSRIRDA